jgi:hypothetical protein
MIEIQQWLPFAAVGISFTILGVLKVYGLCRGIEGGVEKPLSDRLCGT